MSEVIARLRSLRVIPVVTLHRAQDAAPVADALVEGGLPCIEITFRTPAAAGAIRALSRRADILVGAGTVLSGDQVDTAVDAGAEFCVSPGFNPTVAAHCRRRSIVAIPGVLTPTEIEAALDAGLHVFKFFPAETFGGTAGLKAVSGPYPKAEFIPTGGINTRNISSYLQLPNVLACGGSWIADAALIEEGRFDLIRDNAREAVRIAALCSSDARRSSQPPGDDDA